MRPSAIRSSLSGRYLSFAEREEIALLRAQGCGVREIARRLGRSPSTISRELRRNAATRGGGLEYRASTAQWHADRRARRPKLAKLAVNGQMRRYVQDRLSGAVERPGGVAVDGPEVQWIGRRHGRRNDRRWAKAWSPEQRGCVWTSRMMRRCGSRTKRSTSRCMCRAAARSDAS
jgi:transposase-like protein